MTQAELDILENNHIRTLANTYTRLALAQQQRIETLEQENTKLVTQREALLNELIAARTELAEFTSSLDKRSKAYRKIKGRK